MSTKLAEAAAYPELEKVVTMAECARRFYVAVTTVQLAVNTGRLAHRKCGGVVLVAVESAQALWGVQRPSKN